MLTHEISDEIPKKNEIFDFNGMMKRGNKYFLSVKNFMKKFDWWWKFSIFGQNS